VNMFTEQPMEALSGVGFIVAGVGVYVLLGLQRTGPQGKRPVEPGHPAVTPPSRGW
jgi:hypothetical protein